jgi:DNA-binding NtrC family response regulator
MEMRPASNSDQQAVQEVRRAAVLIVEDERIARRALAALLTASGFETRAAESAEEALCLLEEKDAQADRRIALVDLNLPGMNGLDFISRLEGIDPDVLPVLMTAASDEVLGEAVRNRNLIYLRKPLDLHQLLNVISHGDERQV